MMVLVWSGSFGGIVEAAQSERERVDLAPVHLIPPVPTLPLLSTSFHSLGLALGLGRDAAGRHEGPGALALLIGAQARILPEEPAEYDRREVEAYYDWRNDMFFRRFDMQGMGRTDFMTARRTYRVWLDEFGTPIVVTMPNPLFYWVDLNSNGEFEPGQGEMWSDPEEDGINGNERLYDAMRGASEGPPTPAPPRVQPEERHDPLPAPHRWQ
ncbi:MAG: hypothetical protein EPO64_00890 [Nitrospirae bacterium]|nr:MAG: hypothetical protein EPO64_00890 [Nitrospirota bacterium]